MINKREIEIMAPVSSFEGLTAAIQAGANAVYFGVGALNMRSANAKLNFTLNDLPKIAEISKEHNVKSYLALNIIIYDEEIHEMKILVNKAKESNISAIIASDHSVLNYCKKIGIEIHISTQANVSNIDALEYYSQYADTIVLAKELDFKQIYNITNEIRKRQIKGPSGNLVRIEMFVHGGFCMAISGKCYLSLYSDNCSANRGLCKQNCRRSYVAIDQKNNSELLIDDEHILSAKDLCTIDIIDKIIEAGVTVFKIEGRRRNVDYIYTTTKCYREAVDSYWSGIYTQEKINKWYEQLTTVINRGFWDGYYQGFNMENSRGIPYPKTMKNKTFIADGISYNTQTKTGEFAMKKHSLQIGDNVLIVGKNTGAVQIVVKELYKKNMKVKKVENDDIFSIPVTKNIDSTDKLYRIKLGDYHPFITLLNKKIRKLFRKIFRRIA